MQLLSPAHFVFVLWLLTAAAPAATVLINGAMLPAHAARAETEASVNPRCSGEEPVADHRAVSCRAATQAPAVAVSSVRTIGRATAAVESATDASVLHTAVQRRRPRGI